jgi:hypothetical protein
MAYNGSGALLGIRIVRVRGFENQSILGTPYWTRYPGLPLGDPRTPWVTFDV